MSQFEATPLEHDNHTLSQDKLDAIKASFDQMGYAVVGNLVSTAVCEKLLSSMLEDVAAVRAKDHLTQHEKHTAVGHLQLGPRRYSDYVSPELVANPLIESVIKALLGPNAWLGFYNGNVNCPNSGIQPLHFDRPFAWKSRDAALAAGQSWPPPSITVSCSVALSDINKASGATEIFPGTHKETAVTQFGPREQPVHYPELVEKWSPSSRMEIPAGGICFRDPRMWHRGISNPSSTPRPMPALTYHSALAKHQRGTLVDSLNGEQEAQLQADPSLKVLDDQSIGDGRLFFHESARAAFEQTPNLHGIDRNARFVGAPQVVNHFLDAHLLGGARVSTAPEITPYPSAT